MPRVPLAPDIPGNSPTLAIRVARDQLTTLDELARRQSVSRAELVREAIAALLAEEAVTA